jgi:hypothetical protein
MATNTYVALDKITVGTATSSITFSSIPATYTDLVLVINAFGNTGGVTDYGFNYQLNGDTTTNYSRTTLLGDGSSVITGRSSNQTYGLIQGQGYYSTTEPVTVNVYFMNYANSTTYKTVISRSSLASAAAEVDVSMWRKTPEAINSIKINIFAGLIKPGSTFSLYGISAIGGVTPKATGGTVTSDATYYYHTFEMSGNFVPNQSLSCDYLVVAGGGGGGTGRGGGGGAGGFKTGTSFSVTAQSYPITVGGGGAVGLLASPYNGGDGSNSTFSTVTSTGGGGGAGVSAANKNGRAGGSGGGGTGNDMGGTGGAASPSGQGNTGGAGVNLVAGDGGAGGGGGSGAVGSAGSSTTGGAGGVGTANSYSGISVTYAAGGAGGNGTTGGVPTVGAINTGNGGGGGNTGSSPAWAGAAGGSGIVIVRYAK